MINSMNILLINPNRYQAPPVPPIGLECVAGCLEKAGHRTKITDLSFSEDIYGDLDFSITSILPDIVGITVRNVDSVLYYDNQFYLREIKDIVQYIKSSFPLKVLLGGTGLMTNPEGVLEYLGADYAFVGPAEDDLPGIIDNILNSYPVEKITYGTCKSDFRCPRFFSPSDYTTYFLKGGIAGFETHKGCSSSCIYCTEANSNVAFKRPEDIVHEVKKFIDAGYNHFHLCDSEFNEDLDFSLDCCSALEKSEMDMKWAVYMKPAHFNKRLFRLMKATGVYLITLTVDSYNKCSQYWSDVEKIVFHARSSRIPVAIDFLTGFPYEEERVLFEYLDLFRRLQPERVNINTYIRLYKSLQITKTILKDLKLHPFLLGATDDVTMVHPVFYNHVSTESLQKLIQGDTLFRIAGKDQGVNYVDFRENGL